MNPEVSLSDEQVHAYLKRLNISAPLQPDVETLHRLVYAHQCTIPFETVDMHKCETPPSLELNDVFEKMVTRKRGGYCFEMNLLFEKLLNALGYEAYAVFGRIILAYAERRPITHRGIVVVIDDKRYYVDVGFGGPVAAGALLLDESETQIINGETYRMRQVDDTWWAIDRFGLNPETKDPADVTLKYTVMEFPITRVEDRDFNAINLFCSQPGARFRETIVCNLRTETGNYGIDLGILTVRENGKKETTELTEETLPAAVEKYFGFSFSD